MSHLADVVEHALVFDAPCQSRHQDVVVDLIEKLFQVKVYGYCTALLHVHRARLEGLVGASIRSESIARFAHLRVEYGGEYLHKGLLHHSVYRRWYTQLPSSSVWFGDAHSLYLLWAVAAVEQLLSQFCHVGVQPSLQFFHGHAIDSRGSLVAFHSLACMLKIVAVCYILKYALLTVQFLPPPANACCSFNGSLRGVPPLSLPSRHTSPDGVSKSSSIWYKVSCFCLSTFMSFRL